MRILKFGGSSLKTSERINNVIDIIIQAKEQDDIAVVVSAVGGVTDELIKLATIASRGQHYNTTLKRLELKHIVLIRNLIKSPPSHNASAFGSTKSAYGQTKSARQVKKQNYAIAIVQAMINELDEVLNNVFDVQDISLKNFDLIMSFGELFFAIIMSEALKARGVNAEFLDARNAIVTNEQFGNAQVDYKKTYQNITRYFKQHAFMPVITGFIAFSDKGNTTTLGRGGSDYTAALFAAALGADEIEIWSDVDGIMTADPKKVMGARSIENMSYEEAMEMSHFGARVLYPPTIRPAREKIIPIRIKNSFNSQFNGTLISQMPSRTRITGISSIGQIALLRIDGAGMIGVAGVAQRLFGALAQKDISVILISQASSEHSICCAIESQFANESKKAIEKEFAHEIHHHLVDKVVIEDDVLIIAVVGENMRKTPGVSGKLFQALGNKGVNVAAIAQGSSERNISVVINKHNEVKALNTIHDAFFQKQKRRADPIRSPLSKERGRNEMFLTSNGASIFLIGTGNIGSALLRQIKNSMQPVRVIGIANSKTMIFSNNGISLSRWRKEFEKRGETMDMNKFVKKMRLSTSDVDSKESSIFVDCTASKDVAACYNEILRAGISIVTPNKLANSGKYTDYKRLRKTARKNDVTFLYETNVGAGLPIISTINNLIASGDKILKIEAILSGTLSYIFNTVSKEITFSQVVVEAKKKGYTEPDPREDLNGMDVARKLLILAREIGHPLELEDIAVENLVPKALQKVKSEVFLSRLKEMDAYFENKKKRVKEKGTVMRYIAILEGGKAKVSLQEADSKHPFYNLSGTDNIIAITTSHYNNQPLVIKGPGAGRKVTAAGVLQDIIRVFKSV
ncbi:aspartate kinase [Patescibacteria group bacterium AH-259-L07]|nr:aspartate kinase [Patescibacteria group bacterium AH-259-L07]